MKNENEGENTSLPEKTQDQAQKNVTAPSSDLMPTLSHANSASQNELSPKVSIQT